MPIPVFQAIHVDLFPATTILGRLLVPDLPTYFLQKPLFSLQGSFLISSNPRALAIRPSQILHTFQCSTHVLLSSLPPTAPSKLQELQGKPWPATAASSFPGIEKQSKPMGNEKHAAHKPLGKWEKIGWRHSQCNCLLQAVVSDETDSSQISLLSVSTQLAKQRLLCIRSSPSPERRKRTSNPATPCFQHST